MVIFSSSCEGVDRGGVGRGCMCYEGVRYEGVRYREFWTDMRVARLQAKSSHCAMIKPEASSRQTYPE